MLAGQPGILQSSHHITSKDEKDRQSPNAASSSHSLDDDIVAEHFTRNVQFFGRDAQERIMASFVVVVGLGVSL